MPCWGYGSFASFLAKEASSGNRFQSKFKERPPGLIRHVLIVLVFWSWMLLSLPFVAETFYTMLGDTCEDKTGRYFLLTVGLCWLREIDFFSY